MPRWLNRLRSIMARSLAELGIAAIDDATLLEVFGVLLLMLHVEPILELEPEPEPDPEPGPEPDTDTDTDPDPDINN